MNVDEMNILICTHTPLISTVASTQPLVHPAHMLRLRSMHESQPTLTAMHSLRSEHTPTATHPTALPGRCLALHLLADLDVHIEKLGYAAVKAHRFTLAEVGFAVGVLDAFARACVD